MEKYNLEQKRAILAYEENSFGRLMFRVRKEKDINFYRNAYRLLLEIYSRNLEGEYLSKTEACELISLSHRNAAQKYVNEAKEKGFVEFRRSRTDRRRIDVIPKQQLLDFVEYELEQTGDMIRNAFGTILEAGSMPKDNAAFSGAKKIPT